MNPVIIIPTYWTDDVSALDAYDHATPIDAGFPEISRCLDSLEQVTGVVRTILLLVADYDIEDAARERVEAICNAHPRLNPLIIGRKEARVIQDEVVKIAPKLNGECISLRGYGAIRNMGLLVASILGHDVVVFIDDDEVILSPNFLIDGVYGLGHMTRQNLSINAKSGYFIDRKDSCYANEELPWYDKDWDKNIAFNTWMRGAQATTRISRSNHMYGGCMAIHAQAFTRVGFDPFITRGEDLDYLFNLRLYGMDVWFDNKWFLRHLPPDTPRPANRFKLNVYRWYYERAKLAGARGHIGFTQVTPWSLMPYPGPYISEELDRKVKRTTYRRMVAMKNRGEYAQLLTHGIQDAQDEAREQSQSYLAFQSWWPTIVNTLWQNQELTHFLLGTSASVSAESPAQDEDS